jgi:hypothetical protein
MSEYGERGPVRPVQVVVMLLGLILPLGTLIAIVLITRDKPAPAAAEQGDPFAGSAAAQYADGADGIVLPEPAATGSFSAAEVADALQRSRAYLIASNLDRELLLDGPIDPVRALLDPRSRGELDGALRNPSLFNDPLVWLTRFDRAETALVGQTIKVRGKTTVSLYEGRDLVVETEYLFVYAVQPAGGGSVERIAVYRRMQASYRHSDLTGTGTLPILVNNRGGAGMTCGSADGYLHPNFGSDALPVVEQPESPYDQTTALLITTMATCH